MNEKLNNIQRLLKRAQTLCKDGYLSEAKDIYLRLIKTIPFNSELLTNLGTIELQFGNYAVGEELLKKSISVNPNQPHAISNLGNRFLESGHYQNAIEYYDRAINLNPDFLACYYNKGKAFNGLEEYERAIDCYKICIQIAPTFIDAYINLGVALTQSKKYEEALVNYDCAIQLKPDYAEAYYNQGVVFADLKRYEEALANYDRAIQLKPNFAEAYYNQGIVFADLKRYEEALANYDRAIRLNPDYSVAYYNRGVVFADLKHYEEALTNYDRAIQLKPDYAEAYSNRGAVFTDLKRYEEALANFGHAIQLKPDYAEAFYNQGVVFADLKRYEEALSNYDRAIQLKPDYAEAYSNRGAVFTDLKHYEEALASYDRAIQLKPDVNYLLGNFFHSKMHLCKWSDYDHYLDTLIKKIHNKEKVASPFLVLGLTDDPDTQKLSSKIFIEDKYPTLNALSEIGRYPKHKKIRLGYFSADFHNHATMHLIAELFEYHRKDQFELFGFSFGPNTQDVWRQSATSCFDQFYEVNNLSDIEIVSLARELEIDIAVDLKGFTQNLRTGIFTNRAAPIQVNYLGYPGTMGTGYIDYIISDQTLIPESEQQHYSEKVVYLPNSYQVNLKERVISNKAFTREEMGLPRDAFVFCSFNNNYKITPEAFDRWMTILKSVEGSVLWIFKNNDTVELNLRKEAEIRGVDHSRLVFAPIMPVEEHLKRIQLADLFLDTLPYNAHTTASEALRVGLPIVTLIGKSFASRVAASLLNAIGLPELITTTPKDYESLATDLASDQEKLKAIKNKLLSNLPNSPLYNPKLFAQNLETAFQEMYQRHLDDLAPIHIYIQ